MEQAVFSPKMYRGKRALAAAVLVTMGAGLLLFPQAVREQVSAGLMYCITGLAPSLFPFLALVSFGVRAGAGDALEKPLGAFTRRVLKLPACCALPVLLSFIGGYPAGARSASLLLSQGRITKEQAAKMMDFSIAPGVAFVVTYIGGGLLGSFQAGWRLFWAVTVSGLILGVISGIKSPVPPKESRSNSINEGLSHAITAATYDASLALCKMCGCIMAFSGLTAILQGSGVFAAVAGALSGLTPLTQEEAAVSLSFLLEVTGGAGMAANAGVSPVFYAFGLAFGGLCVHLQVFSFFSAFPGRKMRFFLFRLLHGGLSLICFLLISALFPPEAVSVLAPGIGAGSTVFGGLAATAAGGLSLFLMCAAFLTIIGKE